MWTRRFVQFHGMRHPAELAEPEVNAFLTHLAEVRKVSASTQNQALSAILFLYGKVIGRGLGDLGPLVRARRPSRLPVVLTRTEVRAVLRHLEGDVGLVAQLLYGAGLRLPECLRLRVQNVDLGGRTIHLRDGKGRKDRRTMVPAALVEPTRIHLDRVRSLHERDLGEGWGKVWLPDALARKYPGAPTDWRWQWVFPQRRRWKNRATGEQGRHHLDPSVVQRAVKRAVDRSGVPKAASCHTFRHSFATHLLESGYDI
jgi:integron integrase